MGRLSNQAKQSNVVAYPETIPDSSHINVQEQVRQLSSLLQTLQPIFLAWAPLVM
jgi:hypothetical protein